MPRSDAALIDRGPVPVQSNQSDGNRKDSLFQASQTAQRPRYTGSANPKRHRGLYTRRGSWILLHNPLEAVCPTRRPGEATGSGSVRAGLGHWPMATWQGRLSQSLRCDNELQEVSNPEARYKRSTALGKAVLPVNWFPLSLCKPFSPVPVPSVPYPIRLIGTGW